MVLDGCATTPVDGLPADAGRASRRGDCGTADNLTENGVIGANSVKIAAYREKLHRAVDAIGNDLPAGTPVPDKGDLWDLRGLYLDPTWA